MARHDPLAARHTELTRKIDAEAGSDQLRVRSWRLFYKFAATHGISPCEARILLLETGARVNG